MDYADIIQGSLEWFAVKLGKTSSSHISDIMAKNASKGYSATRKNYMSKLICERLTGERVETFQSTEMKRGTEKEELARQAYELKTFQIVNQVGWIEDDNIKMHGSSPDGLVGDDGHIEIKCPNTAKHIETLLNGKIDREYLLQIQDQMRVSGRAWCDFVSYDDRLPEHLRLFIKRVDRDEIMIAEITAEIVKFQSELDDIIKKLEGI